MQFHPRSLADLAIGSGVTPSVNRIEIHPFFQREDDLAEMRELRVQPEAWGPFAEGKHGIFSNGTLTEIGAAHGKSAAQVALRWNLQRGSVVLAALVLTHNGGSESGGASAAFDAMRQVGGTVSVAIYGACLSLASFFENGFLAAAAISVLMLTAMLVGFMRIR